jgi:glycosyltransferase involved in cell wall biosynthesis
VIVGYLGRIVEEKGLSTLVQSLDQIRDLPWKCILVGSGPFEDRLRAQIDDERLTDRIVFTGYIPHTDAPRYLASFDLLVLPSETQPNWKEQFGRVVVEALACGTPVLGSDSGAIPDVIQSLQGGLTFPEQNVEECSQQLARMIQTPTLRNRLASKGRQLVLEQYTHAALAERFAETIERAVSLHKST